MDNIDRLNIIETEYVEIDIEDYFLEMDLTKRQIQERIDFAEESEDLIFFIYAYILEQYRNDAVNYPAVKRELVAGYTDIVERYVDLDRALEGYISTFADKVVNTTQRRLETEIDRSDDSLDVVLDNSYWLSDARATETAVNMALDVINYKDFITAKERGFTRKQWLAIEDNRTRPTHSEANGQVVPVDEFFLVGNAHLMYPHDCVIGDGADFPEEIISCRCSFRYVR